MPTRKEIVDYYDFSKFDYQIYNRSFGKDISMHFGLWDETTRNHKEALLNENRVVAKIAHISPKDKVIDLGCGHGATAVWLASHIGCHVTGITLSKKQVATAERLALERNINHLTDFSVMDFHRTSFENDLFDVVVAIESISHSDNKLQVLKEAHRILKPGGRIVIADGYFGKKKESLTPEEQRIAQNCFEGVHVPPLAEQPDPNFPP